MSERKGTERRSVSVEIAGERHLLRADASAEYTQRVAAHVDSTIRALGVGNTIEPHRAAILAALTITDELFRTRAELDSLRQDLAVRSARLAQRLEEAVGRPTEKPENSPA